MGPLFGGWLGLVFLNMPVGFALGLSACVYLLTQGTGAAIVNAPQRLVAGLDSFPLLAVPFFILAGQLMNRGGVSERIYGFANALMGHFRGGLGHVNVLGSLIFSGMSGSAIADAGGLGILEINAMRKEGYPDSVSGPLTCASCIIGPLVPPSIPMVIYALVANTSLGALFLAGIVPGLLTAGALMAQVSWMARKHDWPRRPRPTLRMIVRAFLDAFWALLTPLIIMWGIFGGAFTPTEAAAIAAFYALFIGLVVYRDLTWNEVLGALRETVSTTAVIGIIVSGASLFGWILAREQVPQQVAALFLDVSQNPWIILVVINLLLLFLGCFMEGTALLLLLVPILAPLTRELGIDQTHFGVVVIMNLMIGILTPPFGVGLFVVSKVGNIPFGVLARGIVPFLVPLLAVQVLITFVPWTVLVLPRAFGF